MLASSVLLVADWSRRKAGSPSAGEAAAPETLTGTPAPGRVYKIGLVYFAPEPGVEDCMRGLLDGLRELGFAEGRNLEVRRAHAQAEIANIPQLVQNYDTQGLDLIVPLSTPCLTAAAGTAQNAPVVFTYVYDPIAAGAGTSFTEHLPNVTGVGSFPPVADTVELMRRLLPGLQSIGTLYNSSEANSRKFVEVARSACAERGIRLEEVTITNASEVFQAAQALVSRDVQVVWIGGDNTAIQGFEAVVKVANDARIPVVSNDVEPVATHSLATVGVGFYDSGHAAATLAARVLLGEKPKDLPIEDVAVRKVAINLAVARRLGLRLPDDVLREADVLVDDSGAHAQAPPSRPTATAAPLAKTWRVDILEYVNVADVEDAERGVRTGLRDAGLVEGRDYSLRVRNAQGDMPTLSTIVDTALSNGSELLITLSTPTLQAALRRAQGVPIVFTFVADAVAAGAGRSDTDHLPNVTGVPTTAAYDELVDLVRTCLPAARRIGTLFVPAEVNSVYNKEQLERAAARRGLELVAMAANTSAEVSDATLALLARNVDALCQVGGNLTTSAFASIAQPARRARVPVFGFLTGDIEGGAVLVAARDYYEAGRDAGHFAARVMRGERPAGIPFQPLRTTRILVNLDAARAVGLTIPPAVLDKAAEVVGQR